MPNAKLRLSGGVNATSGGACAVSGGKSFAVGGKNIAIGGKIVASRPADGHKFNHYDLRGNKGKGRIEP